MSDVAENSVPMVNPVKWFWYGLLICCVLTGACIAMLKFAPSINPAGGGKMAHTVDLKHGQKIYAISCATCHGQNGMGLPHQGAPLVSSLFIEKNTDQQVMRMIKLGRSAGDPKSVMRLPMPAKGGYANLNDGDLYDVTAYIRTLGKKSPTPDNQTMR